jgi:protein-tyrosine phosphatase
VVVESKPPAQVLFVCSANRIRSPFAEAVARRLAFDSGLDLDIISAGVQPGGLPVVERMARAARRFDVDLAGHLSRQVSREALSSSDLIVTMTGRHVLDLAEIDAASKTRTITLLEWASAVGRSPVDDWSGPGLRRFASDITGRPAAVLLSGRLDVHDPMGRPSREFRRVARQIDELAKECFGSPRADRRR